ncbi:nuclear RNA export factor 2-like [Perognathus longimembris pacificus]|uniref:nuclear RNA export factor 2-like n=1 Tax=Perognathus longimembris pacificus TaxID=214514 RepID=UPI002018E6FB|nr:nuclear RNA export factor 2-like [Perognathus longimembris pacificus]
MGQNTVKGAMQEWFKVKIPCGRRYDKTWLMNSIQSYCSVPFTPVDFHYDRSWAQFFVEGTSVADALRDICYKIRGEKSQKVSIFVSPSFVPYSVRYKFTDEQLEQIKLTMKKRYDMEEQALDLQKLRFDPDLVDHDIEFVLNRRHCMDIAVQIIQNSFPELSYLNLSNNKLYRLDALSDIADSGPDVRILDLSRNQLRSVLELNKVKGLKLDELWLDGNPLCRNFRDQAAYQSCALCEPEFPRSRIQIWEAPTPPPYVSYVFFHSVHIIGSAPPLPPSLTSSALPHLAWLGHALQNAGHPVVKQSSALASPVLPLSLRSLLCGLRGEEEEEMTGNGVDMEALEPDGHQFDPPVAPGTDARWLVSPSRQADEEEALRERLLQFLKEYYSVFDNGDRQNLLGAYHDEACFSVSLPANASGPGESCLSEYFKHNRNLTTLKDPCVQRKLLKYGRHDIVESLRSLPQTQHDLSSFMMDVCYHTEKMLCFSVSGLFREEAGGNSENCIRAFTRTIIAIPGSGTNLCIVNDQLFVRDTTSEEVSGTFSSLVAPDARPTLSPVQCEMVQSFSIQSGMKLDWSEK